MSNKIAAAALQYSKRLSRFICWVWAIYRFSVLIVAAIAPTTATALVTTTTGMDTIMLVNVSTYLVNSLGEKMIYSDKFTLKWLDKGGFQHLINHLTPTKEVTEDGDSENG